jgi:hypothetical protein
MTENRDPFWDNQASVETAKRRTNGWDFARTLVFWAAIVAIIYILATA